MEPGFWLGRWERGETGWHQSEVEPALVEYFSTLSPTRVLVPLCGKSLDLLWLASRGHEVWGVELSELAVRSFFSENSLEVSETTRGKFNRFQSGRITILQGDFFDLTSEMLPSLGAVYDRAALIALPPMMRRRYAEHLLTVVQARAEPSFVQLQLVLERTPPDEKGPPFSVSASEMATLYRQKLNITNLGRETLEENPDQKLEECVYRLSL